MDSESTIRPSQGTLRVAIAGGGTGGHISPAVAVIEELRSRTSVEAIWIGSHNGFEREAAGKLEIPFHPVSTGKLRRYLSPQTLIDAVRVPRGIRQARAILKSFKPEVVFSTGGFVSVPSVVAARWLGIPSLTHEQTAYIGLATRINARLCQTIALSFERSRDFLPRTSARVTVTGNPIRRVVLHGNSAAAREHFGLPELVPLLYVTGGAQGSHTLNRVVFRALDDLLGYVAILHQTGPRESHTDFDEAQRRQQDLDTQHQCRYRPVERIVSEIGDVYAASTLVVGRAGAGTVNELAALSLPSILVPLPGAEEQHQNALYLVDRGVAQMIQQDELTPDHLTQAVARLVGIPEILAGMRAVEPDPRPIEAAARIANELLRLAPPDGGSSRQGHLDCLGH